MKGAEDELQTDEAEGKHTQQARNEEEAERTDKTGEFTFSGLLTRFGSASLTHSEDLSL